jgi:type I restriction enzyme S subunit
MKQEKITLSQLEGFLFNTRNTPELFGKCAVWHSQYKRAVCDNNILIVRFKKYINADFISAQLSTVGRNRLKDIADATISVAAIYWKSLKKLKIVCPALAEQHRIEKEEACQSKLQRIKTAIMQDLLTGKKRVTALLNDTEVIHG